MAEKTLSHDPVLSRFAEKQMRNWEIRRAQRHVSAPSPQAADFITIANVVGAGGGEVARRVAEELGWPVYDRELLTNMARDNEARTRLYHSMDERDVGWLEMTLRSFLDQSMSKNDYFHKLVQTVLCLGRQGPAVFVGRAADLILPREKGLRVALIASLEHCVRNFAQRNQMDLATARAEVKRITEERIHFVRNHFHVEAYDPMRFDLLIHMERFTTAQTVELILAAHADRLALIVGS